MFIQETGSGSVGRNAPPTPVAQVQTPARPAAGGRPDLGAIERRYQVAEERSENWSPKAFGAVPLGTLGGQQMLTVTEGRLLDNLTRDRGFLGLKTFSDIKDDATATATARAAPPTAIPPAAEAQITAMPPQEQALARRLYPTNDGHNDAFRHAYWNARLTAEFGETWTRAFTTAHEGNNPGASTREAMDLYNNEVGRRIAVENPDASPRQLADLVGRALANGDLVVVGSSGHLDWSNRVSPGDHGVTIDLRGGRDLPTPAGNASAQ